MRQLWHALKTRLFGAKPPQAERRRRKKDYLAPGIGTYVVYHHLKMQVTPTRSDELWKWLWKRGWRVESYRNDRRSYTLLPPNTYGKFEFASTSDRLVMMRSLVRKHLN